MEHLFINQAKGPPKFKVYDFKKYYFSMCYVIYVPFNRSFTRFSKEGRERNTIKFCYGKYKIKSYYDRW